MGSTSVCRTCLQTTVQSIFKLVTFGGNQIPLVDMLKLCIGLEVTKTDKISLKICDDCIGSIIKIYIFRQTCWDSQNRLLDDLNAKNPTTELKPAMCTDEEVLGSLSPIAIKQDIKMEDPLDIQELYLKENDDFRELQSIKTEQNSEGYMERFEQNDSEKTSKSIPQVGQVVDLNDKDAFFLGNHKIPSTSAQKKFRFSPYEKDTDPTSALPNIHNIQPSNFVTQTFTETRPQINTDSIDCTLQEHGHLLRVILREIKLLRQEKKEQEEDFYITPRLLEHPIQSKEEFIKFESDIKGNPQKEESLRKLFGKMDDSSLEKFVRSSLKTIISNEAASNFSWYGRCENIAVEGFYTIEILKECAMKKFVDAKAADVVVTIKKWFHYAKDRLKKIKQKT